MPKGRHCLSSASAIALLCHVARLTPLVRNASCDAVFSESRVSDRRTLTAYLLRRQFAALHSERPVSFFRIGSGQVAPSLRRERAGLPNRRSGFASPVRHLPGPVSPSLSHPGTGLVDGHHQDGNQQSIRAGFTSSRAHDGSWRTPPVWTRPGRHFRSKCVRQTRNLHAQSLELHSTAIDFRISLRRLNRRSVPAHW